MTTAQSPKVQQVAERFMSAIERNDFAALEALFTPDALLDVNVPAWRFQRQGPRDVIGQFREWYPQPPVSVNWRATPMEGGVIVQADERKVEGGEELYYRFVYLASLDGDRIAELVLYCTGPWDQATVERQRREAPMVRQDI